MNKRLIPFIAIAALLGSCGESENTSSNTDGGKTDTSEVQKYTVTYSKSTDYTVTGLNESGYAEGEKVEFSVNVTNALKEIDKVIVSGTTLVPTAEGKYSFTMTAKNVQIAITLKDKAGAKVAVLTADNNTPKVGDTVTFTLKLDNVAVETGVTLTATTGAELVEITGTKVKCNAIGSVTIKATATVDGFDYEKELTLTIQEGVQITSIATIQGTEPTYNEGNSVNYESLVTIEARVVSLTAEGSAFVYDGTGTMYIFDKNAAKVASVGDYIRVTGTPSRYKPKGKEAYWWQMPWNGTGYEIAKLTDHAEIALPELKTFTETDLNAYAPASGSVNYVKFTGKYVLSGSFKNIYIGASTKDLSYNGTEELVDGLTYNFEGFLAEAKSGTHVTFYATKVEVGQMDPVTSVTIANGETAEVKVGAKLELNASVLPATADPRVTWSSNDETKATVSEDGVVTGVAEGTATITVTTTGKDAEGNAKTATITINVKAAEVINPSDLKLAGTINFNFSAPSSKPNYSATGSVGKVLKANNGFTASVDSSLSLDSSSEEAKVYYADPRDTGNAASTKYGLEGIKFGTGSVAGKLVLTFNSDANIAKVVVKELTSWRDDKKSSLTINGIGKAFQTTEKGADVDFVLTSSTNVLTFSSDKIDGAADFRVIFTGLEIYTK